MPAARDLTHSMRQMHRLLLALWAANVVGRLTFTHVSRLVTVHLEDGFVSPFVHSFTQNKFIYNPAMMGRAEATQKMTAQMLLNVDSDKAGEAFKNDHPAFDKGKTYRRPHEGSTKETSVATLRVEGLRGSVVLRKLTIRQTKRTLFNIQYFLGETEDISGTKQRFDSVCSEILAQSFQNSGFCVFELPQGPLLEGENWVAGPGSSGAQPSARIQDSLELKVGEFASRLSSGLSAAIKSVASANHGRKLSQARLKKALRVFGIFMSGHNSQISVQILTEHLALFLGPASSRAWWWSVGRRLMGLACVLYLLRDHLPTRIPPLNWPSAKMPRPHRPKPSGEFRVVVSESPQSVPTPLKPNPVGPKIILH